MGLAGGFSHCTTMCSPFVFMQITNNLGKIAINDYNQIVKIKNVALIPYHLGRITTYGILAMIFATFGQFITKLLLFKNIATFLLFSTALFFTYQLLTSFKGRIIINITKEFNIIIMVIKKFIKIFLSILQIKSLKNKILLTKFVKIRLLPSFNNIFGNFNKNYNGFDGYILGIILGFIPCGLLYNAFALAITFNNPFLASFGLIIFGIATFPALFIIAIIGNVSGIVITNGNNKIILLKRTVLIVNIVILTAMTFLI
jgi:sulfite exporter TauE/SafE